jgi:hypothetical protein
MGHIVRYTAFELASLAWMWVGYRDESGADLRDGYRLYVGPDVSDHVIATYACRRLVQLRGGVCTERAVRLEVRKYGYKYEVHCMPALQKVREKKVRRRVS